MTEPIPPDRKDAREYVLNYYRQIEYEITKDETEEFAYNVEMYNKKSKMKLIITIDDYFVYVKRYDKTGKLVKEWEDLTEKSAELYRLSLPN